MKLLILMGLTALLCGCAEDPPCAIRYPSNIKAIGQCDAIGYCSATLEDKTEMAYVDRPVIGKKIRGMTCGSY